MSRRTQTFHTLQVSFDWSERQKDGSTLERRHTQSIPRVPFKYANKCRRRRSSDECIRCGQFAGRFREPTEGYSDGKDAGGEKFMPKWLTCGRNLALNKSYSFSVPSYTNWGAGDSDGKKLDTREACGPSYAAAVPIEPARSGWRMTNPVITLDLASAGGLRSFGLNFHGYPWWDALKG